MAQAHAGEWCRHLRAWHTPLVDVKGFGQWRHRAECGMMSSGRLAAIQSRGRRDPGLLLEGQRGVGLVVGGASSLMGREQVCPPVGKSVRTSKLWSASHTGAVQSRRVRCRRGRLAPPVSREFTDTSREGCLSALESYGNAHLRSFSSVMCLACSVQGLLGGQCLGSSGGTPSQLAWPDTVPPLCPSPIFWLQILCLYPIPHPQAPTPTHSCSLGTALCHLPSGLPLTAL